MLAAGACAWGATVFFGPGRGLIAGLILAVSFLLSTEAGIAKTDAVLCGVTTLALAALARIYAASIGRSLAPVAAPPPTGWRTLALFWLAIAVAILDKGPIGPMIAVLTGLCLWAWNRRAPWAGKLQWLWGLLLVAAVVGPWAVAITITTDGGFWGRAVGSDLAPKLRGGQEGHGAFFGLHALLSLLLIFPATFLLPAAAIGGWKARAEPGVRFALCWLVPSWLVFELTPTKLPHYTLPLYGALAWLMVAAIGGDLQQALGRWSRFLGAGLGLLAAGVWAAAAIYLAQRYGGGGALDWALVAAALALLAGLAGAAFLFTRRRWAALACAGLLGTLAHATIAGGLAPALQPLWLSRAAAGLLARTHMDPREGLTPGPVTVVGYAEPSLVFALGTETELGDAGDGGEAISEGRPVLVEARAVPGFLAELAADRLSAHPVGQVKGFDYSDGKGDVLMLYRANGPVATAATSSSIAGQAGR
jgi:4-amino-4-deoxy-L-arabinose transferase-like glycosyltransferase